MITDSEKREITLVSEPNAHILTWGQSGQGKSYFLCRQIEKYIEQKKSILILDFSGSYTREELKKHGFRYDEKVQNVNVLEQPYRVQMNCNNEGDFQNDFTDALLEVLGSRSYYQQELLRETIGKVQEDTGTVTIPSLVEKIKAKLTEENEERGKIIENLENLLVRLSPYQGLGFLQVEIGKQEEKTEAVTILQLFALPEKKRRFATQFILSLLWREIYRQIGKNRYDVIILDEFQFLPVNDGSTLSSMLREGRKKGIELVFSSQYLAHYDRDEIQALLQAGHYIIFRPTPKENDFCARIIDVEQSKTWKEILRNLQKGEAVMCGKYNLNGRNKICKTPILIHIK